MTVTFPDNFYKFDFNGYDCTDEINDRIKEMLAEMKKQNVNWIKLSMANHISIIIIRTGNTYDITVATNFYEAEIDE